MTAGNLPLRQFVAAKGILIHQGRVLFLRESGSYIDGNNVGKYDVPGGRLNPDEDWITGLHREVFEETGLTFTDAIPFWVRDWRVTRPTEQWHIHAVFFAVPVETDRVILSADHDHYIWAAPNEAITHIPLLNDYDHMMNDLIARCPDILLFQEKGAA